MEIERPPTHKVFKQRFNDVAHRIIEHFSVPCDESLDGYYVGVPSEGRRAVHDLRNSKRGGILLGQPRARTIALRQLERSVQHPDFIGPLAVDERIIVGDINNERRERAKQVVEGLDI